MADVVFRLDADQAKAVNSFLRVVDAQKRSERQFKKTTASARMQDKVLGKVSATVKKISQSLLVLGGAGSIVGTLTQISQGMDRAARSSASLETELRPLLSLGDNFQDIESIRQRVLSGSTGLGRGSKEVADAFFALQSGASNLSETVRNDLFKSATDLAFLQNGDLAGSVNLLVKFYQNYGDQVRSVTDLSEKLFATADRGSLTLDELARFGPDVAAAAKIMNVSMEELLGTLIVTTQQLGRNERTFTGVRNIILRMSNAQREGINLTGTFVDKLQQLNRIDPDKLKKVFGDEAISAIAVAAKNSGAVAHEVGRLNQDAGELGKKLRTIIQDEKQLAAINLAAADQARKNVVAGDLDPEVSRFVLRQKDIATGITSTKLGQIQPEAITGFQAGALNALLGADEFLRGKNRNFDDDFLLSIARGFQDVGRETRQRDQQFSRPEAVQQELSNGLPGLGGVAPLNQFKDFNEATGRLERAAVALERASKRRSPGAHRE